MNDEGRLFFARSLQTLHQAHSVSDVLHRVCVYIFFFPLAMYIWCQILLCVQLEAHIAKKSQ